MARAAVEQARLDLVTEAWASLVDRNRQSKHGRAELRAAAKGMDRSDAALSRALADLRALLPMPEPLTPYQRKLAREQAERDRAMAGLEALKAGLRA